MPVNAVLGGDVAVGTGVLTVKRDGSGRMTVRSWRPQPPQRNS